MKFLENRDILRKLLIIIPLNQETLISQLSPILGQFNIKSEFFLKQFVDEFNKFTNGVFLKNFDCFLKDKTDYLSDLDLIIPLYFIIYRDGKYGFEFKTPSVGFLFRYVSVFSKQKLNLKYIYYGIYKISYLKSLCVGLGLNEKGIKSSYIQIRSQLNNKLIKNICKV